MKIMKIIKFVLLTIFSLFILLTLFYDVTGITTRYYNYQKSYIKPSINYQRLRKIALAVLHYAAEDQDSQFPPDLKVLEDKHMIENPQDLIWQDPEAFQDLSFITLFKYKAPRAKYFLYFPPKEEFSDDIDKSKIILAEPYPSNGERQYLTLEFFKSCEASKLPEAEFRELAKKQGLKLPD